MNGLIRTAALVLICLIGALVTPQAVSALPPLPSSFYGTVTVNAENVAVGVVIQAVIENNVVAEGQVLLYEGKSVYALDVSGDDPVTSDRDGGREGDLVQFKIGGVMAAQTGTWRGGTNTEINLTANTTAQLDPPQPTAPPVPTQTAILVLPAEPASSPTAANTSTEESTPTGAQAAATLPDPTSESAAPATQPALSSPTVRPSPPVHVATQRPEPQGSSPLPIAASAVVLVFAAGVVIWKIVKK